MNKRRLFALILFMVLFFCGSAVGSPYQQRTIPGEKDGERAIPLGRKSPSEIISPLAATGIGFVTCTTRAEYENPNCYTCCHLASSNIAYTSDYCFGYWIRAYSSRLGDKYIWKYYRPDGRLDFTRYWEYIWDPEWNSYAYITDSWGSGMEIGGTSAHIAFSLRTLNLSDLGQWRVENYYNETLVVNESFVVEPALIIRMPVRVGVLWPLGSF